MTFLASSGEKASLVQVYYPVKPWENRGFICSSSQIVEVSQVSPCPVEATLLSTLLGIFFFFSHEVDTMPACLAQRRSCFWISRSHGDKCCCLTVYSLLKNATSPVIYSFPTEGVPYLHNSYWGMKHLCLFGTQYIYFMRTVGANVFHMLKTSQWF